MAGGMARARDKMAACESGRFPHLMPSIPRNRNRTDSSARLARGVVSVWCDSESVFV
jgi:hypothetical protein